MYENLTGVQHKSAIVDVTDLCNLRCKHCFYFREEHESKQMEAEQFLKGLEILQKRHNIISMGWSGATISIVDCSRLVMLVESIHNQRLLLVM